MHRPRARPAPGPRTPGTPGNEGPDVNPGGDTGTPETGTPTLGGEPPAHSSTTTQVNGVDEADIIKTDGKYLYVLHGNALAIVDAWPASSLSLAATVPVDGAPLEMYVLPGAAVIFSSVDPTPVLDAASLKPKPAVTDAYVAGPAFKPGTGGKPGATSMTKITVLTLDGASAKVAAEHWVEGDYVSSRRVGTSIRTIINGVAHGPALDETTPATADEIDAASLAGHKKIDEATAADFLPLAARRKGNGAIEAAAPPRAPSSSSPKRARTRTASCGSSSSTWRPPTRPRA